MCISVLQSFAVDANVQNENPLLLHTNVECAAREKLVYSDSAPCRVAQVRTV